MQTFNDDPRYTKWIQLVVGDCRWVQTAKGFWRMAGCVTQVEGEPLMQRCDAAAPMMAKAFPELTVVHGEYRSERTKGYWMYHVWCVDTKGRIVDPTGRQFDNLTGPIDSYRAGEYDGAVVK